ncbi:right-handed parallel beta-helix repeat-containing protein [Chloroflexota bacterium]
MKRFFGVIFVLVLVFLLVAIGLPSPALAATFTVNSNGDATDWNPGDGVCETAPGNGICTLRAAIQEANALGGPDTINLPAGTYTLSIAGTGEDTAATGDLDIWNDLTITGTDQATTIIDGGGLDRVFQVHFCSLDISSVTVRNGNVAGSGGGIYNRGTLTLTKCIISGNTASSWGGGGMYNYDSSAILTDCTFNNNSAKIGGGMFNEESSPIVTNCTFSGNSATWDGGGMSNNYNSSPTVTDCNFSSNSADGNGGGMRNLYSSPILTDCTFSGNSASMGSGIYNYVSSPVVTNCRFLENSAENGGGMCNFTSSPTVTNCTFSGNSAYWGGGGMYNGDSSPTVINCIFSNNSVSWNGGGMQNHESSPTITNCTFSRNLASIGGSGMSNRESSPAITNCILWDNGDEIDGIILTTVTYSDIQGGYSGEGNINSDPMFVNSAANNYHLQWDSPCIDTGTNVGAPTEDIEGTPRPIDGDGDGTTTTDMGAYEYLPPAPIVGGTVVQEEMLEVLMPWLGLAGAIVLITILWMVVRRRTAH